MNILILSPYPPYPPYGGGTMRVYQLVRGLAARHAVTCLTFAPDAAAEAGLAPLRDVCRVLTVRGPEPRGVAVRAWTTLTSRLPDMALRNASTAYAAAMRSLLAAEPFDVVQAESIEMAGYLADARLVQPQPAELHDGEQTARPMLVLDQFNAEYLLQRRAAETAFGALWSGGIASGLGTAGKQLAGGGYSRIQAAKLAAYERRVMAGCDLVLAVSADDRRVLQELAPVTPIAVVPNGVDCQHFSRAALPAGAMAFLPADAIVFSGTLDFRPNVDAVNWFVEQVLPLVRARRPQAQLLVVGRRPPEALRRLAAPGAVTIIGEVADARPYLSGAAAYVVPMRIGGGVRLKMLEALALEAPIVSTTLGAEGIEGLLAGVHCLLADDPAAFAASVLRLLEEPGFGQRLGQRGRQLVRAGYDWSVIIPQLEAAYSHAPSR